MDLQIPRVGEKKSIGVEDVPKSCTDSPMPRWEERYEEQKTHHEKLYGFVNSRGGADSKHQEEL